MPTCPCGPFYSPLCPNEQHAHGARLEFHAGIYPTKVERKLLGLELTKSDYGSRFTPKKFNRDAAPTD